MILLNIGLFFELKSKDDVFFWYCFLDLLLGGLLILNKCVNIFLSGKMIFIFFIRCKLCSVWEYWVLVFWKFLEVFLEEVF